MVGMFVTSWEWITIHNINPENNAGMTLIVHWSW